MNPVITAAIVSGCFATASVGLTAFVAIKGFRSTREATGKAIESASEDTIRALNAARDDRLWEKRAAAYEETISYLLFRQHIRDMRVFFHIMGRDLAAATRFWFGDYKPPGWGEIQGRLVAYASGAVVNAYKESGNADNEALFRFDVWKSVYDRMRKERENSDTELEDDDPGVVQANERLRSIEQEGKEKDQALIDLMRSELQGRPNIQ